jgi:hypothetical protein
MRSIMILPPQQVPPGTARVVEVFPWLQVGKVLDQDLDTRGGSEQFRLVAKSLSRHIVVSPALDGSCGLDGFVEQNRKVIAQFHQQLEEQACDACTEIERLSLQAAAKVALLLGSADSMRLDAHWKGFQAATDAGCDGENYLVVPSIGMAFRADWDTGGLEQRPVDDLGYFRLDSCWKSANWRALARPTDSFAMRRLAAKLPDHTSYWGPR